MYRILVADDEGLMRESIKRTIMDNFGNECEVETAKNGREVIETANTFHPDIAFVDIQMPGLSGIQAIAEIRKTNQTMVMVIITAYDRFSYAQEAVNLNVLEYITKPVNKKKITDICLKAMREVDAKRARLSNDLKVREKLTAVLPMIEAAFINRILQDDESSPAEEYLDMLDIEDDHGYVCVLEFGENIENGHIVNALGSNVRMGNKYTEFRNTVRDFMNCVAGPVMGNRIVLFIPWRSEKMGYEERVDTITRIRNMVLRLEEDLSLIFRAGIGDVKRVDNAESSYREAVEALRLSANHIVHTDDVSASIGDDKGPDISGDLEERFYHTGLSGDISSLQIISDELFDYLSSEYPIGEVRIKVLGYIMGLEEKGRAAGSFSQHTGHENYFDEIYKAADLADLKKWFIERACETGQMINTSKKSQGSDAVVAEAKKYIEENYAKELSLDDTARQVNISPYYFSRLFKSTTGISFIEYLTEYRIKKAKEFMENPRYSIKEICSKCGYTDPNYFSRIFKKYEGVTPTEYRK